MLRQTTKYAFRALAVLAGDSEGWLDVRAIARRAEVAANYLSKVLGQLVRLGVIESRRGKGGGFRLRDGAARTSLEAVVRSFEGADTARRCVFGLAECSDETPCPLHEQWTKVLEARARILGRTTIADLVVPPRGRRAVKGRWAQRPKTDQLR